MTAEWLMQGVREPNQNKGVSRRICTSYGTNGISRNDSREQKQGEEYSRIKEYLERPRVYWNYDKLYQVSKF